jgi:choline-sulfatase
VRRAAALALLLLAALGGGGCRRPSHAPSPASGGTFPNAPVVLVSIDTLRSDRLPAYGYSKVRTPHLDRFAADAWLFEKAFAPTPMTLPSHTSMLTGMLPPEHGVRNNSGFVFRGERHPSLPRLLKERGYATGAAVSTYVLRRETGLGPLFDWYEDSVPTNPDVATVRYQRPGEVTLGLAKEWLSARGAEPFFLFFHIFEPHAPYEPAERFLAEYGATYEAEIATADDVVGRLFDHLRALGLYEKALVVVTSDHGEGLGDHGEAQHGNLVYQSTMHVPLVLVGPGVAPGVSETPVSVRRIFHTVLDWAGTGAEHSLRAEEPEIVLGEAMKPFLAYGWQPQVMAVEGRTKAILAGRMEVYDLAADPGELRDLGEGAALRDYPVPSPGGRGPAALGEEERQKLASLGYVAAGAAPLVRKDAPRPADMTGLFDTIDRASGLFVREEYARAIPLLERIRAADPGNLDAALRTATAHSMLGQDRQALAAFEKAGELAPGSADVRTYLALHYERGREWPRAVPLLEQVVAESPDRLPAVEALARVRERRGRLEEAIALWREVHARRRPAPAELVRLGQMAMGAGRTALARESLERARELQGEGFRHDLELGVLYLDERRFAEARDALDRVPPSHPEYPMALFKRAQASVLLGEPDREARIEAARRGADATTRPLVERERLFRGPRTP